MTVTRSHDQAREAPYHHGASYSYSAMTFGRTVVELLRRYPKIGASCNLYHRLSVSRTWRTPARQL